MSNNTSTTDGSAPIGQGPNRYSQAWTTVRELYHHKLDKSTAREGLVAVGFTPLFVVIAERLVRHAVAPDFSGSMRREASAAIAAARPDIIDRNGETLATDVKTVS